MAYIVWYSLYKIICYPKSLKVSCNIFQTEKGILPPISVRGIKYKARRAGKFCMKQKKITCGRLQPQGQCDCDPQGSEKIEIFKLYINQSFANDLL